MQALTRLVWFRPRRYHSYTQVSYELLGNRYAGKPRQLGLKNQRNLGAPVVSRGEAGHHGGGLSVVCAELPRGGTRGRFSRCGRAVARYLQ